MQFRLSLAVAVLTFAGLSSHPATAETLTELAQQTHYHGIAFARSGTATLLLASHHGLFTLDKDGTATRASPVQDHSDKMLVGITKQGLKPYAGQDYESDMPAFAGALSEKEIEAIVAYLESTWPQREREYQELMNRNSKAGQ